MDCVGKEYERTGSFSRNWGEARVTDCGVGEEHRQLASG